MKENNILEEFVLRVLAECGLDDLSEENKAAYVPQYVAEAQRRVGEALLPLLDENGVEQLAELIKTKEENGEEWWQFWQNKVPNFNQVVATTLEAYAADMKKALVIS